jgi:DNA-binding NtrC family response regulator
LTSALVLEDDRALRRVVVRLLSNMDIEVREAATLLEGDQALRDAPDVVLLDLHLPDGDGRLLLERLRGREPWVPVIVISGSDDLDCMVDVIQRGAYDYLVKPPDLDALREVIDRALAERRARIRPLSAKATSTGGSDLVGHSPAMHDVFKQIAHVSGSDATVLVTGETGAGKELVARAIHAASGRADEPFVAVNCATLSRELLSSELFGHARGAFTGATSDRAGRFEVVGRGTLFLDEVGELEASVQAALLRALQEKTFERLGETTPRVFKGRVVAATNRDLPAEIEQGRFRADLYYRLGVFEIALPPLRDRLEDLPSIIQILLPRVAAECGTRSIEVPDDVIHLLEQHTWPGNVRELRNLLQRMTIMAAGTIATPELLRRTGFRPVARARSAEARDLTQSLAGLEADHVRSVLEATGWHKRRAAEVLGISRPTLDRKIRDHKIERGA